MEKVSAIANLAEVGDLPPESGHTKYIVYGAEAIEASVFRVAPGGTITAHMHNSVRDLFIGLGGSGRVRYLYEGDWCEHPLNDASFVGLPPQVAHEVENLSAHEDLLFVMIHAPMAGYDHVKVTRPSQVSS